MVKFGLALGAAMLAPGLAAVAPALAEEGGAAPTADPAADPLFAEPYVDIDEWRDAPVRHRYVHGGFRGTKTRFSFYLPPADQYRGRFFQHITPVPSSENLAQTMPAGPYNKIGFSIASGAYFVESNGGGALDISRGGPLAEADPTITAFRANAAVAQYSRVIARQMFGGARPFGYAYGGSGGAYRTIGSIENTRGVWDGVVPYVPGSTMAIPNMFSVRMHAMRILWDKFPQIIDAVEPGGSGDPYAGLNAEEAAALREVTRMGFPMQSWFGYRTMGVHGFAALYPGVAMADPGYFTDFWTRPGYLGFDHPEAFAGARMQFSTTIAAPVTAAEAARLRINTDASREDRGGVDNAFRMPTGAEAERIVGFRLGGTPPSVRFLGGDLVIEGGTDKGRTMPVARIVGDVAVLGMADAALAGRLAAGEAVRVDNSRFLAAQTYHRHQVPGPDFPVWDQFRKPDGTPAYPQRPMLIGPIFVQQTSGSQMTGKFEGKMILVASLWDREAMPWQADWYRQRAAAQMGAAADDRLRLWFTDHALHGDERGIEDPSRTVSYQGVLQQALRDLADWVERGVAPPRSTGYRIDDGQVIVAPDARARAGIQPVVTLSVNGGERAEVRVGQPVRLAGAITVPPGAGTIVSAAWDFEGAGTYAAPARIARQARTARVSATYRFDRPGTYFVGLKGVSQRQGDAATPYARIENIDRVRVVVR